MMAITAEDWVGAHSMKIWICVAATFFGLTAPIASKDLHFMKVLIPWNNFICHIDLRFNTIGDEFCLIF